MTIILIGLIAALGVGGVAAASGGSGGGGSSPSAVSVPVNPGTYNKPSQLSVLSPSFSKAQINIPEVSFVAANSMQVKSYQPAFTNSGYLSENDTVTYETLTLDNYHHSDEVADYFIKTNPAVSGEYQDEPGVTYTNIVSDQLVLGGRQLGLTAGDFGYYNNQWTVTSTVGLNSVANDIFPFYMYHSSRLMSSHSRSDTAHFDGTILGNMYYDSGSSWRNSPLTGTASLDLNFSNAQLTGHFDTQVEGKEYHKFNVNGTFASGKISNSVSGTGNSTGLSVDTSKAVDSSLASYSFKNSGSSSRYATFNAALLNGTNGSEIAGSGYIWQGNLDVSFGFGAKEYIAAAVTPGDSDSTSGTKGGGGTVGITNLTGLEQNLIKDGSFYGYPMAKERATLTVNDGQIIWGTSLLQEYRGSSEEDRTETHIDLTFTENDKKENKSSALTDYYEKTNQTTATMNYSSYTGSGTVTQVNTLILAGKKLGLTAAEVGLLKETRSKLTGTGYYPSNHYTYAGYSDRGYFYMYDQDRLYGQLRSDRVAFTGSAIFTDDATADIYINVNFANETLRGNLNNSSDGKKDVPFWGYFDNRHSFHFSTDEFNNSPNTCSGGGELLNGNEGIEAVGHLSVTSQGESSVSGIFGAKQVQ